jgi:hypothetical protein
MHGIKAPPAAETFPQHDIKPPVQPDRRHARAIKGREAASDVRVRDIERS